MKIYRKIKLTGDLIITDPFYIMNSNKSSNDEVDDWDLCNYGENMENLGFKNAITHETYYGEWSCTVLNMDRENNLESEIGHFCSDSGMVGVFLLDEVLAYNPAYESYLSKPYTAAHIKDFNGTVYIVNNGGETAADSAVSVVGKGNLTFYSKQTGF